MPRQVVTALCVLGILAAACGTVSAVDGPLGGMGGLSLLGLPGGGPGPAGGAAGGAARLEPFPSCDGLLDYFRTEALARVGPYGLGDGVVRYPWLVAVDATESALMATAPAGAGGEGGYSATNVQVAGVDEPDIIETDGERVLIVMNGTFYYLEVAGDDARLVGSLALPEGWDHRFFMLGDRALVFSRGDGYAVPLMESGVDIAPSNGAITLVQEIDLSDPAHLRLARTLRIEGNYVSARAIESTVRLVISSYPADLPFVYPSSPGAEKLALEANRRVVEQSSLEDWLPSYTLSAGDQLLGQGLLVDCEQTHRPATFAGFDTLSVLTLDLGESLAAGAGSAVVAQGETVYSSSERLYVATNAWVRDVLVDGPRPEPIDEDYSTSIHAFDITGSGPARYLASGSVEGHLLNQFAMDEHEGYLRVATTAGAPWGGSQGAESAVTVLTIRGGRLEAVGRVGDLGKGESIYSVRFLGPTGYVVTFRQTDPLYVIDLRDPVAPRVTGELKISGYSAYLHPLGEGRLLGVGREATEEGWVTAAKATLFDVSDPGAPRAVDTWALPDGYSDVEFDHLAFLYWAPAGVVVLPMQDWSTGFAGAVVLEAGEALREVGRVSHVADDGSGPSGCVPIDPGEAKGAAGGVCPPDYYPSSAPITRSLVIGDTLWSLSWLWLQGNDLAGLEVVDRVSLG